MTSQAEYPVTKKPSRPVPGVMLMTLDANGIAQAVSATNPIPMASPLPTSGGGALTPAADTAVNSNVGTTLSAASIISSAYSIINRMGVPTADFSDTTDTAANIIAAIPQGFQASALAGEGWLLTYSNNTAYNASILPGTGVTLIPAAPNVVVPVLSTLTFVVTQTGAGTIEMEAVNASNLIVMPATLYRTITATTGITLPFGSPSYLKYLARSGPTAAFTDTTDTAANMIAGTPSPAAGVNLAGLTWTLRYINNTNFPATLAGGTGVTLSGATQSTISPTSYRDFMYTVTSTSPAAVSVASVGSGSN